MAPRYPRSLKDRLPQADSSLKEAHDIKKEADKVRHVVSRGKSGACARKGDPGPIRAYPFPLAQVKAKNKQLLLDVEMLKTAKLAAETECQAMSLKLKTTQDALDKSRQENTQLYSKQRTVQSNATKLKDVESDLRSKLSAAESDLARIKSDRDKLHEELLRWKEESLNLRREASRPPAPAAALVGKGWALDEDDSCRRTGWPGRRRSGARPPDRIWTRGRLRRNSRSRRPAGRSTYSRTWSEPSVPSSGARRAVQSAGSEDRALLAVRLSAGREGLSGHPLIHRFSESS